MNQIVGAHSFGSASRLHILIARNLKKTHYIAVNTSCLNFLWLAWNALEYVPMR
jgi:hypothetical protein